MAEAVAEAGLGVGRHAEGQDVDDLGVGQILARRERLDQALRLAGAGADEDAVAGLDHGDGRAAAVTSFSAKRTFQSTSVMVRAY